MPLKKNYLSILRIRQKDCRSFLGISPYAHFPVAVKGICRSGEGKLMVKCSWKDFPVITGKTVLPSDFSKALWCECMDLIDISPDLHNSKQYVSITVS